MTLLSAQYPQSMIVAALAAVRGVLKLPVCYFASHMPSITTSLLNELALHLGQLTLCTDLA